jgi:hypothetical protein
VQANTRAMPLAVPLETAEDARPKDGQGFSVQQERGGGKGLAFVRGSGHVANDSAGGKEARGRGRPRSSAI